MVGLKNKGGDSNADLSMIVTEVGGLVILKSLKACLGSIGCKICSISNDVSREISCVSLRGCSGGLPVYLI